MGRMQMKDRIRQIKKEEQYTIHGSRGCIYIGAAGIVFGIVMAAFCMYSRIHGNPTASIGIMLLFLILFSAPGIYLIAYGSWSLTVQPETVVISRLFGTDRIVSLKDVTRVKWRISGYNRIRITGYEKLDENLWRLISSGIIDQEEISLFCSEECRRLDTECRKYSQKLSEKGVKMAHGMVMLTDGFANVTGSENGGSSISFTPGEEEFLAEAAYVICFLKNDRILYAKKDELLFYLQDVVKSVTVETPEGKKKIYLLEPVMYAVVKYVAQYCLR